MFGDDIAVGASLEDQVVESVDHLREHFLAPAAVRGGRSASVRRAYGCTAVTRAIHDR